MTTALPVGLPPGLVLVSIALLWGGSVLVATASNTHLSEEVETFKVGTNESLTAALEAIQDSITNGSGGYFELLIPNGTFSLNTTDLATFINVSDISIIGAETTVIDCEGTAGWVFMNVTDMTIANIKFQNCSSLQNSSSTNTSHDSFSYIEFSSALYLLDCNNLQIENVTIQYSPGVGLAMFNIHGNNSFCDCNFTNNPPLLEGGLVHGAGGVILEFSYCSPGDVSCNSSNVVEVTDASFEFTNCRFESNRASSVDFVPPPIYPHGTQHWGFGKGGGMAVYFKGRAVNNVVTLKNCFISGNVAEYSGGGLYVEFGDESQNNIFNFTSINGGLSSIEFNGYLCGAPSFNQSDKEYSGGGARVVFMYYPPGSIWPESQANVTGNQVEFSGTFFANNMACWGGGAAVVSSRSDPSMHQTNTVHFRNCTFGNNMAVDASALAFSVLQPDTPIKSQLMTPLVEDCVFRDNRANSRSLFSNPNIAGYEFGIGALYVAEVPVNFTGINDFISNTGSGLVVCDANVFIGAHSSLQFKGNNGRRGGALVVTGDGALIVHPGVVLNFTENEAWEIGGAIYTVGHFGERKLIYEEKCFVRYYKPTVHPNNWNASFIFSYNSVAGVSGNGTIYATSLLGCVWPEGGNMTADIEQALCWPGWVYDGENELSTCSRHISTAPASFNNSYSGSVYHMKLYPGHKALLPVEMKSDNGKVLSPVVFRLMPRDHSTTAKLADNSIYVTDNKISVSGDIVNATEQKFFLETLGPRVLSTTLEINILPCPPGFAPVYNGSDSRMVVKCRCGYSMYFTCNSADLSAHIKPGYCVSYDSMNALHSNSSATQSNSTHPHRMIVVKCPATAKKTGPILLPKDYTPHFEKDFCSEVHREGRFCSNCLPGYSVDVNDINDCVKCTDEKYRYGWLLYILTNILPITIFFAIVALFKVSATSAPMYAFVFFAQITTVRYFHNQFPWIYGLAEQRDYKVLRPLLLAPYCIWNLDFFVFNRGICLSPHLTNLGSLLLQYLLAFYPMALILLSYFCIELYDRNFKLLVWLWSPFRACLIKIRRSWQPKTSIIDAFATFLMLSYTKITFTTIALLTPAKRYYVYHKNISLVPGDLLFYFDPQYEYFENLHLPMGLLALVVGAVFVIAPPVFLFLYPTQMFQRCLNKCGRSWQALHTFADAFHGCFKNRTNNNRDYRYFAGLYFVLRIMILVIYAAELQLYQQLLLQQILCILAVLLFALVKPYKEPFYNKVDLVFFTLLSAMNILGFSNYTYSIINEDDGPSTALFAITYALGFLPLIYIIVYVFYLFLKWRGVIVSDPIVRELTAGRSVLSITADENSVDGVPDRLLNPQNYPVNCTPDSVLSVNSTSSNDSGNSQQETKKPPRQRATEGSYFLKKAQHMKNYSSI